MKEEYYNENSWTRYYTIKNWLEDEAPSITKGGLKGLLSTDMPIGIFNHTTWSAVFDLTDKTTYIRFGAADLNEWREFSLNDPVAVTEYSVKYSY